MRRFNTIIESANPPGINQLWIDKKKLRYFTEGKWHLLGGGGSNPPEISDHDTWIIDGEDTGKPTRGEEGSKGDNGLTPFIGTNKHWWIGTTDTGVVAEGTDGIDGDNGLTPQLRVTDTAVEYSYDGVTWTELIPKSDFVINYNSDIYNNPDEEDITSVAEKLKFKDKAYSAAIFSGLGRVYLRKNLVDGKNILTQDMINQPSTIYYIQYDYDLGEKIISIPEGSIIKFEGGSINNGTLNITGNIISSIIGNGIIHNVTINNSSILNIASSVTKDNCKLSSSSSVDITEINIFEFDDEYDTKVFEFGPCIDITKLLKDAIRFTVTADIKLDPKNIYVKSKPRIVVPSGRYIITEKIDVPTGITIDFQNSTIIPYSEDGTLSTFLDDDSGRYVCFRIGNYYYYNYEKIQRLNHQYGSFGNLYITNANDYSMACIKISDNTKIHDISFNKFKGSLLYNNKRSNNYTDSGYVDNKTIEGIFISGSNVSLFDSEGLYDVEIYWGDASKISRAIQGDWLIENADGVILDSNISTSLYVKNSKLLINNWYSTHAKIDIQDSFVQINKGLFIQNNYINYNNYDVITVKSNVLNTGVVSVLELNSCIFAGRGLSSYNINGGDSYYDINRDDASEVKLNSTYRKFSNWDFKTFNSINTLPYSNISFESTISNTLYTNIVYNPSINDGVYSILGSSGLASTKYIKILNIIDKDRMIGKESELYSIDFVGTKGIVQFSNPYNDGNFGNYIGIYIGDDEVKPNESVLIPLYKQIKGQAFRFFYNGYSIDNTYKILPTNSNSWSLINTTVDNSIIKDGDNVIVRMNTLPTIGRWKAGDICLIDSSKYIYSANYRWELQSTVTTDYTSINTNTMQRMGVVYDSSLRKILFYLGLNTWRDVFGALPTPTTVNSIESLVGTNKGHGCMVFDTTLRKPFWNLNDQWIDANGNRSSDSYYGGTYDKPSSVRTGFQYFDTTLNKPFWWTGSDWITYPDSSGPTMAALTFTGAVEATYNGSTPVTVNIPTGGGGTTNYEDLSNKPKIGNVELVGTKTLVQLGIQPAGDYATETYVTEQIAAAVGNINSVLDTINGEVI